MAKKIAVLLDADYLAYSAGFAAQHTHRIVARPEPETLGFALTGPIPPAEWEEIRADVKERKWKEGADYFVFERVEVEPVENALHTVKLQINGVLDRVRAKFPGYEPSLEVYLTGTGNFRERIATIRPYKGNRKPWHKPRLMNEIREYLVRQWGAKVIHDQEADDEVAIRQTEESARGRASCIVGIDKDLWQVPGWHHSTSKSAFARIAPALGLRLFYRQILSGDATDNVGGCFRVGAEKAKSIIVPGMAEPAMWSACVAAYKAALDKFGPDLTGYKDAEQAALENARLLWLRRDRTGQLWNPPC